MSLVVLSTSGSNPVTVSELRDWARIASDDDSDTFVSGLITRAREYVEQLTGRQLIRASLRESFDCFPDVIRLSRPPLSAVSSITYTDTDEASQTLSTDSYTVDSDSEPGRVVPAYGEVWPSTLEMVNAVQVTFTAGYTADTVPQGLKHAILALAKWWYDGNEATTAPKNLLRMIGTYRHGDLER